MNLDRIFVGCAWAGAAGTVFFWIAGGLVAGAIMSIWLSVSLTDAALISVGPGLSVAIGWSAVFGARASFDFGLDRAE